MRKGREFPGYGAVQDAVESIGRGTVLLQNLAEYGERTDADALLRQLWGLSAAAHRGWRELNEQLTRTFTAAVEREDVSMLVREMADVTARFPPLAVQCRAQPLQSVPAWTARLAEGGRLLREMSEQLPLWRQDNALGERAQALYTLRREGDAQLAQEARRLRGAALDTAARFHDCCAALARLADTMEWVVMKNT